MARILVADSETEVQGVLKRILQMDGHEVKPAQNGPAAMEMLLAECLDMAILEIALAELDGLAICRRLRGEAATAGMPVVFLTSRGSQRDKIEGFEAGCDQYIVKPFSVRELRWRVHALLRRGEIGAALHSRNVGPLTLDGSSNRVRIGHRTATLTPVEYKLLTHLALEPGGVFSSEQLLNQVWGFPKGRGNPGLVRAHIMNLRAKIEATPESPTLIQTIPRHGYTLNIGDRN